MKYCKVCFKQSPIKSIKFQILDILLYEGTIYALLLIVLRVLVHHIRHLDSVTNFIIKNHGQIQRSVREKNEPETYILVQSG
jgi:hypothetical protein